MLISSRTSIALPRLVLLSGCGEYAEGFSCGRMRSHSEAHGSKGIVDNKRNRRHNGCELARSGHVQVHMGMLRFDPCEGVLLAEKGRGMTVGRMKIGQVGTGHAHAAGKMAALRTLSHRFEVVGIVEPSIERQQTHADEAAYRGLRWMKEEELLETTGLQIVAVETTVDELVPTAAHDLLVHESLLRACALPIS